MCVREASGQSQLAESIDDTSRTVCIPDPARVHVRSGPSWGGVG